MSSTVTGWQRDGYRCVLDSKDECVILDEIYSKQYKHFITHEKDVSVEQPQSYEPPLNEHFRLQSQDSDTVRATDVV